MGQAGPQRGHLEQNKASWLVTPTPTPALPWFVLECCPHQVFILRLHRDTSEQWAHL